MAIELLRVTGLRNLQGLELALHPSVNLIYGPNGAGKTSVLEALSLISHGRSFRGGTARDWVAHGEEAAVIFVQTARARLGLEQTRGEWRVRIDGQDAPRRGDALRRLRVVAFHAQTQELVTGGAQARRALLDYVLFHVEPAFDRAARDYRRALAQRNQLLRGPAAPPEQFEAWEHGLAQAGERLSALRREAAPMLISATRAALSQLSPSMADQIRIEFREGWDTEKGLARSLAESRATDLRQSYTRPGSHRDDLVLRFAGQRAEQGMSRGQQKLLSLALLLAQAERLAEASPEPPVLLIDDLAAELDRVHRARALSIILERDWQTLFTATGADELDLPAQRLNLHLDGGRPARST